MDDGVPTTAGVIAIGNLQAQIESQERQAAAGGLTVHARAALVDLVALRGHVLGRIADHEWAGAAAEQLARDAASDGDALLARARMRAMFHRFDAALADLDEARRRGADPTSVDAERGAVLQALGRHDLALAIHRAAVERRADFTSLAGLATLHAERGDISSAESCFGQSRARFRGVSPIPLARLDLARAKMWITQGDLPRARTWLDAAVRRLPAYAPAIGHLAEIDAARGETEAAMARLLPLTSSSDDPAHQAQLARIMGATGRHEAAIEWRSRAAARYDELVAAHPEAFAEHAAEFWLEAPADPQRALRFATKNLEARPTSRAHELVRRAEQAADGVPCPSPRGESGTTTTWR